MRGSPRAPGTSLLPALALALLLAHLRGAAAADCVNQKGGSCSATASATSTATSSATSATTPSLAATSTVTWVLSPTSSSSYPYQFPDTLSATFSTSVTQSHSACATATQSQSLTSSGTLSQSPTHSPSLSVSPTASVSPSLSATHCASGTLSPSGSLSLSVSDSASASPSPTGSYCASASPTFSPSPCGTSTPSRSATLSPSGSVTSSLSHCASSSGSASLSPTFTPTTSPSISQTSTQSISVSLTPSSVASPSRSSTASPTRSFATLSPSASAITPSSPPTTTPTASSSVSPMPVGVLLTRISVGGVPATAGLDYVVGGQLRCYVASVTGLPLASVLLRSVTDARTGLVAVVPPSAPANAAFTDCAVTTGGAANGQQNLVFATAPSPSPAWNASRRLHLQVEQGGEAGQQQQQRGLQSGVAPPGAPAVGPGGSTVGVGSSGSATAGFSAETGITFVPPYFPPAGYSVNQASASSVAAYTSAWVRAASAAPVAALLGSSTAGGAGPGVFSALLATLSTSTGISANLLAPQLTLSYVAVAGPGVGVFYSASGAAPAGAPGSIASTSAPSVTNTVLAGVLTPVLLFTALVLCWLARHKKKEGAATLPPGAGGEGPGGDLAARGPMPLNYYSGSSSRGGGGGRGVNATRQRLQALEDNRLAAEEEEGSVYGSSDAGGGGGGGSVISTSGGSEYGQQQSMAGSSVGPQRGPYSGRNSAVGSIGKGWGGGSLGSGSGGGYGARGGAMPGGMQWSGGGGVGGPFSPNFAPRSQQRFPAYMGRGGGAGLASSMPHQPAGFFQSPRPGGTPQAARAAAAEAVASDLLHLPPHIRNSAIRGGGGGAAAAAAGGGSAQSVNPMYGVRRPSPGPSGGGF